MSGVAGRAEDDGGDRVAVRRRGGKAKQQRHRGRGIHVVGEGQKQRGAGDTADAWKDTQAQTAENTGPQQKEPMRLHQPEEPLV